MPRARQDFTPADARSDFRRGRRPIALSCFVRLDRLRIAGGAQSETKLPPIRNFRVLRDSFVRQQTSIRTYLRCRHLINDKSGTRIYWQYARQHAFLSPSRITLIADDITGLAPEDVRPVAAHCRPHRVLLVEIALDFDEETGVDHCFVRRHAIFGKSRPCPDRGGEGQLRYGARSSGKMVRAYRKPAVNSYRVELEFHSGLLRSNQVRQVSDLANLRQVVCPTHFSFVAVRWPALRMYLARHQAGVHLLDGAKDRAESIHAVLRYLRQKGVNNVHRFLTPLRENVLVQDAVGRWAATSGEAFHGD